MTLENETISKDERRASIKTRLKKAIYVILTYLGIVSVCRFHNRHKVAILTFHGIMDFSLTTRWIPLRHRVSTAEFQHCLAWLAKHYTFISMDKAIDILQGNSEPVRNALVLTFDDGYKNNFECALPIMQKFAAPGMFYVPTGFVDTDSVFWFDRLDYALQSAAEQCPSIELAGENFNSADLCRESLRTLFDELRRRLKSQKYTEKDFVREIGNIAEDLERQSGRSLAAAPRDLWTVVATWNELKTVGQNGLVSIGSHSVNHTRLSFADPASVRAELRQSKMEIEEKVGIRCRHFAYPNGEYDDTAKRLVQEEGYWSAVTTEFGLNGAGDDVFALKRIYPARVLERYELLATLAGVRGSFATMFRRRG